ncbi:DUF4199 domain-containing protein [Mucilaginibacter sp.]|uniref:DUF4199 domain-containing protein n=1 Tax=Mucilaginibacter sp. TaxID=1882438 RepID=UPI0035BBDF47
MKRNVLVFGLISGLLISVFLVCSMSWCYRTGSFEGNMIMGFSAMFLAFSFIFVAVKNYRYKYNGGVITFGKAFTTGLLITLITSTMYVLSWAIEYHFFMPDWLEMYNAHQLSTLKASGANAAQIAAKTKEIQTMTESYRNPVLFVLFSYMEILPVGLLVSIVTALILKKKIRKI